ncbi:DUF262 domain-containing protein [Haladaptatus cibarius]|uniref:DUF262 domain-containing protein n=1 Tax=Haladaptatus cibarius TaxID=453847 RepID=UPI0006784291|nr:DUF262 domain-containing protein [Haladaptatus cibarius]
MSFQSMTIANAVRNLNTSTFLPGIQREFVWNNGQIRRLFDSVLRGYPIGSLLFWEIRGEYAKNQIKYKFIEHYIEDSIHPEQFSDRHYHNPKINEEFEPSFPDEITLVLDGQQRLTAFLIGLTGSYTEKEKYKKRKDPDAWERKKLYMNLLSDPNSISEDELQAKYEFKFLSDPSPSTEEYWYDVSKILSFNERDDVYEESGEIDERISDLGLGNDQFRKIFHNLESLYDAIHETNTITYHTETKENHDRVLDIFIRANEGGTQLSKTEILLSIITSQWADGNEDGIDAREELTHFVDRLNDRHEEANFKFDVSLVLRGLLLLSDVSAGYSLKSFDEETAQVMKNHWEQGGVREALIRAIDLLVEFGFNKQRLTSIRAPLPIAYYFYKNGNPKLVDGSEVKKETRRNILFWLCSMIVNGTFSIGEEPIVGTRRALQRAENDEFPIEEINEELRGNGRPVGLDEDTIRSLLRNRSMKGFSLLLLMHYPHTARRESQYHEDHIFPKSKLKIKTLMDDYGLTYEQAQKCHELRDSVANKQLLTDTENAEKSDLDFKEWIKTRDSEYFETHLIPSESRLYDYENFPEFVERREELVIKHLKEKFDV